MKIEVDKIPASGLVIEAEESPSSIDMSKERILFNEPINIKLKLNLVNNMLIVRGSVETKAVLECSRCLKQYTYPIKNDDYHFECEVKPAQKEIIDLTEGIREDIILRLPLKSLCSEQCKGICPKCGQDLNMKSCGCRVEKKSTPFSKLDELKLE